MDQKHLTTEFAETYVSYTVWSQEVFIPDFTIYFRGTYVETVFKSFIFFVQIF